MLSNAALARSDEIVGRWLRVLSSEWLLLSPIGFFGGAAHALPEPLYIGGALGPFDALTFLLLLRWLLFSQRIVTGAAVRAWLPFGVLAVFAYIGEIAGGLTFGANTWSGTLAPLRFLYYPTLFVTLSPLLSAPGRLRILFFSYISGVLFVSVLAWLDSPDPTFFFGLPVLYNPNVIGNFIGYAMICLGFRSMPKAFFFKGGCLAALFVFSAFTFSKASWLLALGGAYINIVRITKLHLVLLASAATLMAAVLVNWQDLFVLVSAAIDMKLASSIGGDTNGGTIYMRLGFLIASLQSLIDYPFGVGLKNFWFLNYSYANELGALYFDSDSPHTALGFMSVQAGWIGVMLLAIIFYSVMKALFLLYDRPRMDIKLALIGMVLVSILFQIEFLTQPFIYLVLAAAIAQSGASYQRSAYGP